MLLAKRMLIAAVVAAAELASPPAAAGLRIPDPPLRSSCSARERVVTQAPRVFAGVAINPPVRSPSYLLGCD